MHKLNNMILNLLPKLKINYKILFFVEAKMYNSGDYFLLVINSEKRTIYTTVRQEEEEMEQC